MYKCFLFVSLIITCCFSFAQSPQIVGVAKSCSSARLKKNLYYLASDELKGRMTASHEDTMTALFVAQRFKAAGLQAPYNGSYMQPVPILLEEGKPAVGFDGNEYKLYDGWSLYPPSIQADVKQCPVVYTPFTTQAALKSYLDTANLQGMMIILQTELFSNYVDRNAADSLDSSLQKKGIAALLFRSIHLTDYLAHFKREPHLPVMKLADPAESRQPPTLNILPEISFTQEQMKRLLADDSSYVMTDSAHQKPFMLHNHFTLHAAQRFTHIQAPNIIGVLPGSDTSLPCVVISAHHDHDGHNGDIIWHGAVDNGSGTVAIVELANLMKRAVQKGLRPKRTLVFASFTGEERGLLGSFWYADHPVFSAGKTFADLNIDMLGRVDTLYSGRKKDSNYVYINMKDSLGTVINFSMIEAANQALPKLVLDSFYQKDSLLFMRSDQYPFAKKGTPVVWFDCGFNKDYHKPTDTADKVDYDLLTRQTQLAFLTLWKVANE